MNGRFCLAMLPLLATLHAPPAVAQGPLTTQGSASAQPTMPKPMPDLDVPVAAPSEPAMHRHHVAHRRSVRPLRLAEPFDRPALANVELLEPLPHPPQPPHVVVPTPAYPFEDLAAYVTTPPPPIVCRRTRYDRFKPDLALAEEKPVLCTADNP